VTGPKQEGFGFCSHSRQGQTNVFLVVKGKDAYFRLRLSTLVTASFTLHECNGVIFFFVIISLLFRGDFCSNGNITM